MYRLNWSKNFFIRFLKWLIRKKNGMEQDFKWQIKKNDLPQLHSIDLLSQTH